MCFWLLWLRCWLLIPSGSSVAAPSPCLHFFLLDIFFFCLCLSFGHAFYFIYMFFQDVTLPKISFFWTVSIYIVSEFSTTFYPRILITTSLEAYKPETTESHKPTWRSGITLSVFHHRFFHSWPRMQHATQGEWQSPSRESDTHISIKKMLSSLVMFKFWYI